MVGGAIHFYVGSAVYTVLKTVAPFSLVLTLLKKTK
jgi:hypothetical protein